MVPESFAAFVPLKPEPIYKYSMEGAGENKPNQIILFKFIIQNILIVLA